MLAEIFEDLNRELEPMSFAAPTELVYNPLEYAWETWADYLERFARPTCEVMLLGMNPGPFGMAQTGVPFGEIEHVRDWLGVHGRIGKPPVEHEKRPIEGFACSRSEVSGRRLWGWAKERWETPDRFFDRFFIANYCPLVFMEDSGRNRTPDKLPKAEKTPLFKACDKALRRLVEALEPTWMIGVGAFAEKRARAALKGIDVKIGRVLHPSPASPLANRGWAPQAEAELAALGIAIP